jgi:uncharacterized glyoxalase superfamily protein PhnB
MEMVRMQRIFPYLSYADAPAAIDFLCRAFGFEERMRHPMPDGRIGHAELEFGGPVVMLASSFEGFGDSPLHLPDVHGQLLCIVDDVDAHFARAKAGGATLTSEPCDDHGMRRYRAMDPEGHRWIFATPLAASALQATS